MTRLWFVFALAALASLTGCNAKAIMDRIAPETVQQAKTNFDYLRHGQYDLIEHSLDPSIDRKNLHENFAAMAALVPPQEPVSIKTVGAFANCQTGHGCDTRVTLEYEFPDKWLIVQMVVHRQDAASTITSFFVRPETQSLEATNRFTLNGKSATQYSILGLAIVSIAVMLYALVLCIRTPMEKRKWLWTILILLGAGKVAVDWTTAALTYHTAWIAILPAGLDAQLYGAWTVSVSLPLGAIIFLVQRESLRKKDPPPPPVIDLPPAPISA